MYFFIQFCHDLKAQFSEKGLDFHDFYADQSQKFFFENNLPKFHEYGDGIWQGDATDLETLDVAEQIEVQVLPDGAGDYDFSEVFEKLDRMFIDQMEKESKTLLQ